MATKQEKEVKKISRATAANTMVSTINGKTTLEALAEKADQLFVDGGGESKVSTSRHYVRRALETAEAMGILKLTKPTDMMVEKVKR